jgi:hypothetical protein
MWRRRSRSETAENPPILSFSTEQEPSPTEGELSKLEEMIDGMRLQLLSTEPRLRHSHCENMVHMQWTEYLLGRLAQIGAEAAVTNWQAQSRLSDRQYSNIVLSAHKSKESLQAVINHLAGMKQSCTRQCDPEVHHGLQ